ncbi:A-kinase anchor protein inhibitor 1 isoform X1 [Anser cygnoides]|uniref:A-kinase anchor protein inhibitor 1 isoform X1 n=1 Tax=Anser cygnoides TaxID=8845 RepID=UPI002009C7D2|nr:A-kinase anchor protein inhibitor 1 isoform X1 [Anser cygnoides]
MFLLLDFKVSCLWPLEVCALLFFWSTHGKVLLQSQRYPQNFTGEKPGPEQDEVKLQNASKQIVQTAILQAVQQVSQESQQKERRTNSSMSLQLERGKLTKKHEKK